MGIMNSMKTSFFKRKPDLHAATIEYFEAGISFEWFPDSCIAQAFYVAEDLEHAIEYYEKSADIDEQVR